MAKRQAVRFIFRQTCYFAALSGFILNGPYSFSEINHSTDIAIYSVPQVSSCNTSSFLEDEHKVTNM
ncbi:Uncharacterised protein [Yersinia frederiksenii]|nr:Uncharacterised protein [Yersinia frederiksenii]CNI40593.1 Uncharacterised protein [Yersinia frederiksenii]CNK87240.1 Uncharacterised protein [Yersinia frederiksenii]CNK89347.1 Uncharacterised protein [Yersinia frederiksenii]